MGRWMDGVEEWGWVRDEEAEEKLNVFKNTQCSVYSSLALSLAKCT